MHNIKNNIVTLEFLVYRSFLYVHIIVSTIYYLIYVNINELFHCTQT